VNFNTRLENHIADESRAENAEKWTIAASIAAIDGSYFKVLLSPRLQSDPVCDGFILNVLIRLI
jgi:hypothetical protein